MTRVNQILCGALVLQLVLVALFWLRGDELPSMRPLEPIVPELEADEVSRVTVHVDGGSEPVIDLEKRGERWVLESHDDYPADDAAVKRVIGQVAGMAARAPTATGQEKREQLRVAEDQFERKLILGSEGGDQIIYLGVETDFRQTAVRLEGQDAIYTVPGLTSSELSTKAADWIDPVYVSIPIPRIVGLSVENGNGAVNLERDAKGVWTTALAEAADGGELKLIDPQAVNDLLNQASRIELDEIVGTEPKPEHGFAQPRARVTLAVETQPGSGPQETYVLEIGAKKNGLTFVRALGQKHIVLADAASVKKLVELDGAELPEASPAPPGGNQPPPGFP